MSDLDAVLSYLKKNQKAHLKALKNFLSIESISTQAQHSKDVKAAAEWVTERLRDAGIRAKIHKTKGHPIVLAEKCKAKGKPTILIYGHYDVQPAFTDKESERKWKTQPFKPTVVEEKRTRNIYARGASDDKGQMLTHILAAGAWLQAAERLPVNVKFLLEGEEEIGSPNLETFIREHKEDLAADYVVVSDTAQYAPGMPAIVYGLRGIAGFEVIVSGPKDNLHSGSYGGSVPNPIHVLTELVAKMHDKQGRVTIPGFYDDVVPLADWEKKEWQKLKFNDEKYRRSTGVPGLFGEKGFSTLERRWSRPTLEVNGIGGGYQGEGSSTIITDRAFAKFTMRLVPNQKPTKIQKAFRDFVKANTPDYVKSKIESTAHGAPGVLVDTTSGGMAAARRAMRARHAFGKEPVLIREGGSIPVVLTFKRVLNCDTLLLGWGRPDDNIHGANEKLNLDDFYRGIATSATLMDELSRI